MQYLCVYVCFFLSRQKNDYGKEKRRGVHARSAAGKSEEKQGLQNSPLHRMRGLPEVDVYKCLWEVIKGTA